MSISKGQTIIFVPKSKQIPIEGKVITVLKPMKRAEDILNENDITKLVTRNIGCKYVPLSTRVLVKVTNDKGFTTYHTPKINNVIPIERKTELKTLKAAH